MERPPVHPDTVATVMNMNSHLITGRTRALQMLNMCLDTLFHGRDGFKNMMALGWT